MLAREPGPLAGLNACRGFGKLAVDRVLPGMEV